jgi:hypothetical protein
MADQRIAGIEERYGIALEIRIFSWANAPPDVAFG